MNLRSSRSALLALGIGAALATGLVPATTSAQTAPRQLPANPQLDRAPLPPPQSNQQGGPNRADPRGFDHRPNRFEDRLDRRLDFLHSELRINPAQEQLWAAFADAVRSEAQLGRDQFFDRRDTFRGGPDGRSERPGIVERLERRQQDLAERSAHYNRLLSTLRPLYAALNEEQREAANENLFALGRDDRGRRGPGRFGMNREFGGFEPPYGPYDRPNDGIDRSYR